MNISFVTTIGLVLSFAIQGSVYSANEECKRTGLMISGRSFGKVLEYQCRNQEGYSTKYLLNDQQELFRGQGTIGYVTDNSTKKEKFEDGTLFIFQDASNALMACPVRMFLLDLTGSTPRVFAFGIKNACAEYHWASWGKKRSVLAIKENVRFTYSNGKLIPPPADFGDGVPLSRRFPEDGKLKPLAPFVEEIPIK